jgi:hypothetical protein
MGSHTAMAQPAAAVTAETEKLDAFLTRMALRARKTGEELAALNGQFAANRVGTVIQPRNLVTKEALLASRKKVDTFKALVARRSTLLWQHFSEMEKLVASSGLSERDARAAMAGADANRAAVLKAYDDLGQAQLDGARAMEDLLAFAQRNLGHTAVQNGEWVFEAQPALDDYRRIMLALDAAGKKEGEATRHLVNLLSEQKTGRPADKRRPPPHDL